MQPHESLKRLDGLIENLGGSGDASKHSEGQCALLLEHLQAARRYLLGSMPAEYGSSLGQAKESTSCIADKSTRAQTKETLRSLINGASDHVLKASLPAAPKHSVVSAGTGAI
jgi:hypothetical protein